MKTTPGKIWWSRHQGVDDGLAAHTRGMPFSVLNSNHWFGPSQLNNNPLGLVDSTSMYSTWYARNKLPTQWLKDTHSFLLVQLSTEQSGECTKKSMKLDMAKTHPRRAAQRLTVSSFPKLCSAISASLTCSMIDVGGNQDSQKFLKYYLEELKNQFQGTPKK